MGKACGLQVNSSLFGLLFNFGHLEAVCACVHTSPLSHMSSWPMPEKPTSEQIRREAEKLRETAVDLMEHAALLINKSADLEKLIQARNKPKTS
jgi:hypothetical protein